MALKMCQICFQQGGDFAQKPTVGCRNNPPTFCDIAQGSVESVSVKEFWLVNIWRCNDKKLVV